MDSFDFLDEIFSQLAPLAPGTLKGNILQHLSGSGIMAPFDLALVSTICPLPEVFISEILGENRSEVEALAVIALHERCRDSMDGDVLAAIRRVRRAAAAAAALSVVPPPLPPPPRFFDVKRPLPSSGASEALQKKVCAVALGQGPSSQFSQPSQSLVLSGTSSQSSGVLSLQAVLDAKIRKALDALLDTFAGVWPGMPPLR